MSHSSKKSTVHNLQTAEDQQQITDEDHQHLIPKEVSVPKIHQPQAAPKPPSREASPVVAHPDRYNPQDEPPLPKLVEPSFKSIPRKDYSPSSPASQPEANPYLHPPEDVPRGYLQSTVASPVVGYLDPQGLPPPASNPPQDYLQSKEVLLTPRPEPPSSRRRRSCCCKIL